MGPKRKKADSSTTTTHLVFQEGNSNKFWKITIDGTSTIVNYGKVGTAGQTSTKEHKDAAAAEKFATKEIAGKKKKGYNEAEADANSTSEKPSKVTKTATTNTRRWVYVVRKLDTGCKYKYLVFSSQEAFHVLPEEDCRDNKYDHYFEYEPYGENVVETLDEAKKRLDAIFQCGSANEVNKALKKGKINEGPIYNPANFVESRETTDVYVCGLQFDYYDESVFIFVLDNSDDYKAFGNYLEEKNKNHINEEDEIDEDEDEWLKYSKCDDTGPYSKVWTLKEMKEMSESDLEDWANDH